MDKETNKQESIISHKRSLFEKILSYPYITQIVLEFLIVEDVEILMKTGQFIGRLVRQSLVKLTLTYSEFIRLENLSFPELKILRLFYVRDDLEDNVTLTRFPNLRNLHFDELYLRGSLIVTQCTKLYSLCILYGELFGIQLPETLRILCFKDLRVPGIVIAQLLTKLKNLEHLQIDALRSKTKKIIKVEAPNLKTIRISGNGHHISLKLCSIENIEEICLSHLSLSFCTNVSQSEIRWLELDHVLLNQEHLINTIFPLLNFFSFDARDKRIPNEDDEQSYFAFLEEDDDEEFEIEDDKEELDIENGKEYQNQQKQQKDSQPLLNATQLSIDCFVSRIFQNAINQSMGSVKPFSNFCKDSVELVCDKQYLYCDSCLNVKAIKAPKEEEEESIPSKLFIKNIPNLTNLDIGTSHKEWSIMPWGIVHNLEIVVEENTKDVFQEILCTTPLIHKLTIIIKGTIEQWNNWVVSTIPYGKIVRIVVEIKLMKQGDILLVENVNTLQNLILYLNNVTNVEVRLFNLKELKSAHIQHGIPGCYFDVKECPKLETICSRFHSDISFRNTVVPINSPVINEQNFQCKYMLNWTPYNNRFVPNI